jgi:D-alanyl-D-alanine carboxypeptidase/D-alanyl-D-alanine-endopeptidase (penicillin-binding protein 4)
MKRPPLGARNNRIPGNNDKKTVISEEKVNMLMLRLKLFTYLNLSLKLSISQRRMLFIAAIFLGQLLFNSPMALAARFDSQLEAILKRELPPDFSITMQVVESDTDRVLMEKNPDTPLVPASTLKIATTATALSVLKPDFVFVTEILVDNARGASVGNLYVRGFGDPYMVSEELYSLARELRERGLKEVRGNIAVDDSFFEPDPPLDENEKIGIRAYHAPYSALSLNFNSVKVIVRPGVRAGEPAEVALDPVSEYAEVKSAVKTVKGSKAAQIEIFRNGGQKYRETIRVEGSIGEDAPIRNRYVNVSSPSLYTGEALKEFLLREGIRVQGKIVQGKAPANAVSYWEHTNSKPLSAIVYGLNKFSNNFMAEQINLTLGAQVNGVPGTREKGLAVIRRHLLSCGIPETAFTLSEASGLSRNNRISSSALVKVLQTAARDFTYNAEFMASFGVAGVDGTLKEKFTDAKVRRRLRAKTGNLRGVNALAGYAVSSDGKPLTFAVIVNGNNKAQNFVDYGERIMRAILDTTFPSHAQETRY